jgi:hypothetical protein
MAYAPSMPDVPPDKNAEERIAELEAEVARLRQREDARPEGASTRESQGEVPFFSTSRLKVIVLAIGIALVVIAAITTLYAAISSGFDSFAHKASKILIPESEHKARDPSRVEDLPRPQEPAEEGQGSPASPQAPGL